MKEKLKDIQKCLINQFKTHMNTADTKELYEVMDMIKDIDETIYYCTIVEAMEKDEDEEEYKYYIPYGDRHHMMFYSPEKKQEMHRYEGKSPKARHDYMKHKEDGNNIEVRMKELEKYIEKLNEDIMEMIEGVDIQEKQMLNQHLILLAGKVME